MAVLHDTSLRKLLRENGVALALLRMMLPASLASHIKHVEILSESFVSDDLRAAMADAVIHVTLDDGRAFDAFCVVEHKRTEEAFALVQVLKYMAALYERQARTKKRGPLAPVLPLIIFNGARQWTGPRRFSQLLTRPEGALDFEVALLDLGATPMSQLSDHPLLRGGLLALKAAATKEHELESVLTEMLAALRGDDSTLRFFLRYLTAVSSANALPYVKRAAKKQEGAHQMQTIAEFLEARGHRRGQAAGRRKGRAEGREEGRAEGLLEGRRSALKQLLRARFKTISPDVLRRIDKARVAKLDQWFSSAVTAKSLRSVFSD